MAMHTVLMMVVTVSNLSLNTLVEILLKYQRLRKIDSKRKQTKVVCTRNFQNDTLRNPKENCPGTERGGVNLTISRERKKFFLALRSRYFRRGFSSNMCILEEIQSPERQLQENKSLEIGFLFFWKVVIPFWRMLLRFIPRFLPNLPIRYRKRSPEASPAIDSAYTIPKSRYPLAARKAEMNPTVGHSKNISKNMMKYLYWMIRSVMFWISIQGWTK